VDSTSSSAAVAGPFERADGFVVNLDHQEPGLEERVGRFAEEVIPLIRP